MIHWLIIIFGVFFLTLSISNPLYDLAIKKIIKTNQLVNFLLRVFFFILSVLIIFLALYIESLY